MGIGAERIRGKLTGFSLAAFFLCATASCSSRGPDAPVAPVAPAPGAEKPAAIGASKDTGSDPAEAAVPRKGEWLNSIGMRFRAVPAGDLTLVAPLEGARERISLRAQYRRRSRGDPPLPPPIERPARVTEPYSISVCEVTQADYERVMGKAGDRPDEPERPVAVSWEEATEFSRKLSALPREWAAGRTYRLPTLAEWQLAGIDKLALDECYPPWYLSVRHIAVWNWCLDLYDPDYYRALPTDRRTFDPRGAGTGSSHVIMLSYAHPDPFSDVVTFRVVVEMRSDSEP